MSHYIVILNDIFAFSSYFLCKYMKHTSFEAIGPTQHHYKSFPANKQRNTKITGISQ